MTHHKSKLPQRHHQVGLATLPAIACLLAMGIGSGCSRSQYRLQADRDVYGAISQKAVESGLEPSEFSILPGPESRMYDPFDLDCPPMPFDDPASHELMHEVDGKRGYPGWHRNGEVDSVDSGSWIQHLPRNELGAVVLDSHNVLSVAMNNSRDYQTELEDLYLSALDVTFERFRFDVQFFADNATTFTADGPDRPGGGGSSSSLLDTSTNAQLSRLTATGGEYVVGLANSIIWQFSGPNTESARTILDFSLVQPLLRFGGRRRVLERLTLSERDLLANVRQMQQFQQGFLIETLTGRNSGQGPSRGGNVGAAGLGLLAGFPSGRSGAAGVSGYLGLLQEQQEIRNQEANVEDLREIVPQLAEFFEAGRLDSSLQVEQARQALYNAQSSLLVTKAAYKTRLDSYKVSLGLPPDIPVTIDDPMLDRFNFMDPAMIRLRGQVETIHNAIRSTNQTDSIAALQEQLAKIVVLHNSINQQIGNASLDLSNLEKSLPNRHENLEQLKQRSELRDGSISPEPYREDTLLETAQATKKELENLTKKFSAFWTDVEKLKTDLPELQVEPARELLKSTIESMSNSLIELMLKQASARLQAIVLTPIEMEPDTALETAWENRLDLMNARARLVDAWRVIEFDANALQSDLNVVFEGDLQTVDDNPLKFRDTTGRLRVGVEFDTPLTRIAERNDYREALINYQKARRDFLLFEDNITLSVHNTLRIIDLIQLNFELRREAVRVAITQVDQARLQLTRPPKPGERPRIGATATRDLVSALGDLLNAQNDFLNVWVSYESLRMLLDFELGTLQLDEEGRWIDSGSRKVSSPSSGDEEPLPLPEILPPKAAPRP